MTLVLSVHSRDSFWLVADRRISYGGRQPPVDDAVKMMSLNTADGIALLGYAGLGATPGGTQPSEWMSAVLRGRGNLTLEQSMEVLAAAATRELPKHLAPGGAHVIIAPAFVHGVGACFYAFRIEWRGGEPRYRTAKFVNAPGAPSFRIGMEGSGRLYLESKRGEWVRSLLRLVKRNDSGKVSDELIADQLAKINYETHQAVPDTVGPHCMVVWRRRPDVRRIASGGAQLSYSGTEREGDSPMIPAIWHGEDLQGIVGVLADEFQKRGSIEDLISGTAAKLDIDEANRRLANLPSDPDEKLR
jgi:hypothetical protein